jgi:hypothetical protein
MFAGGGQAGAADLLGATLRAICFADQFGCFGRGPTGEEVE